MSYNLFMSSLVVPDEVVIRLVDEKGNPLRVRNVLLRIHVFANRKNDFVLQPFATDSDGVAIIHSREIMAEVAAHYDSGLMDYNAAEECQPTVEIAPMKPREIEQALHSRMNLWTSLLRGESERWTDIRELLTLYRNANNGTLSASPVRQAWDGSSTQYTSLLITEQR